MGQYEEAARSIIGGGDGDEGDEGGSVCNDGNINTDNVNDDSMCAFPLPPALDADDNDDGDTVIDTINDTNNVNSTSSTRTPRSLTSFIHLPIRRINAYVVHVQELLEATPAQHTDHRPLQEALAQMKEVCRGGEGAERIFLCFCVCLFVIMSAYTLAAIYVCMMDTHTSLPKCSSIHSYVGER